MKRCLSLLCVVLFFFDLSWGQGTVQGIPHPYGRKANVSQKSSLRADTNFSFDDIEFWVGDGENRAALVIEWHDGKNPDALVWGYKWSGQAKGIDMISAVAGADSRLILLRQYTGNMGYTINGIGYNASDASLIYDLEGARTDDRISFKFDEPNVGMGQTSVPENPAQIAQEAIRNGLITGIIDHPFNKEIYGYACYDYDYWKSVSNETHWLSGWYDGYWSYWVKDSQAGDYIYSPMGASGRDLVDGGWDGWSYNADMTNWEGTSLGENFIAAQPLSLNKKEVSLNAGDTESLNAECWVRSSSGLNWESSDENVVTVSSEGKITAKVVNGEAKITVSTTDGKYSTSCKVIVTLVPVQSISLSQTDLRLEEGKTATLTATVLPENATNKNISWTSTNEAAAKVENGVVTAIKEGNASITVTAEDGNITATCNVTVVKKDQPAPNPVESVSLDRSVIQLVIGETYQLHAQVLPENAENKTITWSSSASSVASVSSGDIKGLTAGKSVITVTTADGNHTASCTVNVVAEKIQPELSTPTESSIQISFPPVENASSYRIYLYGYDGNKEKLIATYYSDSEGNLYPGPRSMSAQANKVSITLNDLNTSTDYFAKIEALNGYTEQAEIITSFQTAKFTTPVSNISIDKNGSYIEYYENTLYLMNMDGFKCSVISITGKVMEIFEVRSASMTRNMDLTAGVYILNAQKGNDRIIYKFSTK